MRLEKFLQGVGTVVVAIIIAIPAGTVIAKYILIPFFGPKQEIEPVRAVQQQTARKQETFSGMRARLQPSRPACDNVKWQMRRESGSSNPSYLALDRIPAGCQSGPETRWNRTHFPLFEQRSVERGATVSVFWENDPHPEHYRRLKEIEGRFRKVHPDVDFRIGVEDNPDPNASAPLGLYLSGSEVPALNINHGMFDFLPRQGELAFVIGHEVGHTLDRRSDEDLKRYGLLPLLSATNRQQHREFFADCMGFGYVIGSGYDERDVGSYFGRMMQFSGEGLTPWSRARNALEGSHPVDQDRIDKIRDCTARLAQSGEYRRLLSIAAQWPAAH